MPEQQLRAQLEAVQQTLDDPEIRLSAEERSSLEALTDHLEARLLVKEANEDGLTDPNLVDGVNLMVEELSERYPTTAATLRNVMQSLANMGI